MYALTETWLHPLILDNEILPTNYSIYCNDRSTHGAGVLFAIHDDIPSKQLSSHHDLEVVAVEINITFPHKIILT